MKNDRENVDDLVRTWDRVMAANPEKPGQKLPEEDNPYLKRIESDDAPKSTSDVNLSTAFTLLATWGFNPDHLAKTKEELKRSIFARAGQSMAERAEIHLGHTLHQLYKAMTHAKESSNRPSQELFQQLRGMILMVYAWGYVIDRTQQLELRDMEIFPSLAEISATLPDSAERHRLTKSAENKLEQTVGLLLQAIDSARRQVATDVHLIMTGALMILYALANCHFGYGADYIEAGEAEVTKIQLPT